MESGPSKKFGASSQGNASRGKEQTNVLCKRRKRKIDMAVPKFKKLTVETQLVFLIGRSQKPSNCSLLKKSKTKIGPWFIMSRTTLFQVDKPNLPLCQQSKMNLLRLHYLEMYSMLLL